MEVTGTLHLIRETQQVTERFCKREFVVELDGNPRYPQFCQFELHGDRCEQLDEIAEGDGVEIRFDLQGREWTSPQGEVKYFNTLKVWEVRSLSRPAHMIDTDVPTFPADGDPAPSAPLEDDLPF